MNVTQESFDTVLAQCGPFRQSIAFHNGTLRAVAGDADGKTRITFDIGDHAVEARTPEREDSAGTQYLKSQIGQVGCVVGASGLADGEHASVRFEPYLDQSLRRRPEIDCAPPARTHRNEPIVGWSCDARGLFLAPVGVIPGTEGQYVPDTTEPLTLFVPEAFKEVCADVGLSSEQVLRGFIADAASLRNSVANPRADGYSSNGSDERDYAENYIERAWGHGREEAAKWQAYREESREEEELFADAFDRIRDLASEHDIAPERLADVLEQHFANRTPASTAGND